MDSYEDIITTATTTTTATTAATGPGQVVPDLNLLFEELNQRHFEGLLSPLPLSWNPRLKTSAGRFFSGSRRLWSVRPPRIEIARYLVEVKDGLLHIRNALAHEMIHYWLWDRKRPYGHTNEFKSKMNEIGLPRYNLVPMRRPYRYVYVCQSCNKEFFVRKKLGILACAECCKKFSNGRFDMKYRLEFERRVTGTPKSDS